MILERIHDKIQRHAWARGRQVERKMVCSGCIRGRKNECPYVIELKVAEEDMSSNGLIPEFLPPIAFRAAGFRTTVRQIRS